ncbi:MAG TPA: MarR family transcriptional regulator [Dongiaceae bacterium]|nr:MarR family transcriptional regulator [Dongiaceae bacterium]
MASDAPTRFDQCNCFAIRQAARHMTQFYDHFLAPTGLRTTQFTILAKLQARGPLSVNGLAEQLVMDRTTLGRNIQPLEREGLIEIAPCNEDRRAKEIRLSKDGVARLRAAAPAWAEAQSRFEEAFGRKRSANLRDILNEVVASDLQAAKDDA